jgi:type II restriction/modification system DNA methylase subunit YeeA
MNTTNLKKYAPQARRDFMAAVSQRLNQFGIAQDTKGNLTISTPVISGTVLKIEGFSASARDKLVKRAEQMGFEALVEQMAYTWFNRLSAIRFMELHGYLDHNLRVLSHPDKANSFDILDHAQDVAADLGLDRNHIVELKLAGNKDEELYRTLLLGQCHQLHQAMPFLFEALDDETELLLPDNLTRTDSILRGLVDSIPEEDWQQVEIIGWLYQFYISEKKDQVIGSVVKSEDIPAATQLFTPNWIVKYLVQNSVGRQWLMTYPDSGLKAQMEYYIEPAEQEPSVVEALAAITPIGIDPETLKVLDPACGSGHILVEAYDILKAIYEERGYRVRDIPKLILEKNLYGLDIDDRAAQLAGFALMMKAREDDRRIFTRDIKLNVLPIQSTQNLDQPDLWRKLALNQDAKRGSMESIFDDVQSNLVDTMDDIEFKQLRAILALFEQAKTLGSLIQVPHEQAEYLRNLTSQLQELIEQGDNMQKFAATTLLPYVQQAWLLAEQYEAVVANPPYMGGKGMNPALKEFAKKQFPDSKSDLFAMFIERGFEWCKPNGFNSMVTMQSWMFLSSYEDMRKSLLADRTILTMAHLGARAFAEISGEVVQTTAFISFRQNCKKYKPAFFRLVDGQDDVKKIALRSGKNRFDKISQYEFNKIPGSPIAYWAPENILQGYSNWPKLSQYADCYSGLITKGTDQFIRYWFELSNKSIYLDCKSYSNSKEKSEKWFPLIHQIGSVGLSGQSDCVVFFKDGGERYSIPGQGSLRNRDNYFKRCISWADVGSGNYNFGLFPIGYIPNSTSHFAVPNKTCFENMLLGVLNSSYARFVFKMTNPTIHLNPGEVAELPIPDKAVNCGWEHIQEIIDIEKDLYVSNEVNLGFLSKRIISSGEKNAFFCAEKYKEWIVSSCSEIVEKHVNNEKKVANLTGFSDIDLQYKYELESEFFEIGRKWVSYSIGCMMGRYSLDEPGLVYAHAGNVDFDPSRYPSFPADDDGILPLTDQEWFKDDATNRFREFLLAVWGEDTLQQNLEFVAESLTLSSFKPKKGETSLDTVRRYLSNQFYKDHLQTYKKRPIYWLFSSGKQKAFECLVYLHRYNESTLARMRTEYVTPLLGKYSAYADQLNQQMQDASSSEATRIKKDMLALEKKQTELRQFDDKLKHYADMRIKLDLDDGVKVNYGKFGDLLAEVKAITGGAGD